MPNAEAIKRPANTRPAVAPIVIISASSGDGPEAGLTPIDQRVAVLKNFTWSAKLPTKMWGGGNSFGSAIPKNHSTSQIPVKRPIEAMAQPARAAQGGTRSRAGPGCTWITGAPDRTVAPPSRL